MTARLHDRDDPRPEIAKPDLIPALPLLPRLGFLRGLGILPA